MFRRRPLRRRPLGQRRPLPGPGAPPPRRPLPSKARQALIRANRLMADGQWTEAASVFERLAGAARNRGTLIRAAHLILQASRARLAAGDIDAALEHAREGLRLFVRGGRAERVPAILSRMTAALRDKGYGAQADALEREVAQALEEMGLSPDEPRRPVPQAVETRGTLPAHCNGCGAPLIPDEVEWHDAYTAECPYCGTVIKAT
jgi:tetratricopeptide (TPR) repeat protein